MSKMCKKCGAVLNDEANFCASCGTSQDVYNPNYGQFNNYNDPNTNPAPPSGEKLTEKQFYDMYAPKKTKNWVTAIAVMAFITAGASAVLLLFANYLSLIDIAFYVPMGILTLTKKKWGFPLAITIYSGTFSLLGVLMGGTPSGILAIVIGIFATIHLRKVNIAYQNYETTGQLPQEPIQ